MTTELRQIAFDIKTAKVYYQAMKMLDAKRVRMSAGGTWTDGKELVFARDNLITSVGNKKITAIVDGVRTKMRPYVHSGLPAEIIVIGEF